jgi:hypothetical protein
MQLCDWHPGWSSPRRGRSYSRPHRTGMAKSCLRSCVLFTLHFLICTVLAVAHHALAWSPDRSADRRCTARGGDRIGETAQGNDGWRTPRGGRDPPLERAKWCGFDCARARVRWYRGWSDVRNFPVAVPRVAPGALRTFLRTPVTPCVLTRRSKAPGGSIGCPIEVPWARLDSFDVLAEHFHWPLP